MNTSSEMAAKLLDHEYRSAFVESHIDMALPFKIKALRKQRNWTQPQLAERTGMKQSRISAIEKPGGGKLNIDTLCRLASAFDVALDVEFIPFGELMRRSDGFDADSFSVKSYSDELAEDALIEERKVGQVKQTSTIALSEPTLRFLTALNEDRHRIPGQASLKLASGFPNWLAMGNYEGVASKSLLSAGLPEFSGTTDLEKSAMNAGDVNPGAINTASQMLGGNPTSSVSVLRAENHGHVSSPRGYRRNRLAKSVTRNDRRIHAR